MTVTLESLTTRTGLAVLDHLERQVAIPVVDGLQAQGDLIVIPRHIIDSSISLRPDAVWGDVPPHGVELVRGVAGGHSHTLVADPGTCRWTTGVRDSAWLAIGMFEATAPVYLLHPEHGASGCAPGSYVVRRQREREDPHARLVAD